MPLAAPTRAQDVPADNVQFPTHLVPSKKLGKGAYGTVWLCDDAHSGEQVAVKHIRDAHRSGKSTLREIVLLSRLRHENLLHLIDLPEVRSPDFKDVMLVLPYMQSDLNKIIQSGQELSERHIQAVACQILRGLAYLHAAGVAHRDLKPANLLLNKDCKVKISDFGLARGDMPEADDDMGQNEPVLTEYVVTRWYRAPEIMLLPQQYTCAVDLWSVGCILGEMFHRKPLFTGKSHIDMLRRYWEVRGSPQPEDIEWVPEGSEASELLGRFCPSGRKSQLGNGILPNASKECLDLVHRLLAWDPAKRPSASGAQEHAYLSRYLLKTAPEDPELFDWSFDNFRPTSTRMQERLYAECARLHPEILDRDYDDLLTRGFFERAAARGFNIHSCRRTTPLKKSMTPRAFSSRSATRMTAPESAADITSSKSMSSLRSQSQSLPRSRMSRSATAGRPLVPASESADLKGSTPVKRPPSAHRHHSQVELAETASPKRARPGESFTPSLKVPVRHTELASARTGTRRRTPTPRARREASSSEEKVSDSLAKMSHDSDDCHSTPRRTACRALPASQDSPQSDVLVKRSELVPPPSQRRSKLYPVDRIRSPRSCRNQPMPAVAAVATAFAANA